MARKPSVILTPAEKKQAVGAHKNNIKDLKTRLATQLKDSKTLDKDYKKESQTLLGNYTKTKKAIDKEIATLNKLLTTEETNLLAINPPPTPKAVPSPTVSDAGATE